MTNTRKEARERERYHKRPLDNRLYPDRRKQLTTDNGQE
jgi:hypothetical protein